MSRSILSLSIAQALTFSLASISYGATISVNSMGDDVTDDGLCTLREAIAVANSNADANGCTLSGTSDATSIDFLGSVGNVNGDVIVMSGQSIVLSADLPQINSVVSIQGNDAVIDGGNMHQPFDVPSGQALKLDSVTVQNGSASGGGGGLYNRINGTATISNSTFSRNSAGGRGGALFNGGTAMVSNSTLSGNAAASYGGGLYNGFSGTATVINSTFSGNSAGARGGGGLYNGSSSTATISNSIFSENLGYDGGGLSNSGTAMVSRSTFSGNSSLARGGGLFNATGNTATVSNSTFSGNTAPFGGGGLWNQGTATVSNSTLSANSARLSYGGGLQNEGTATISNSVLANSVTGGDDCVGSANPIFTNSLIEDGSCSPAAGNLTGDPLLGPLADNGGPTPTHLPLAGSPLIDAVVSVGGACAGALTDQRGEIRPFNRVVGQMPETDCDIGAVENQGADPVPVELQEFSVD